MASTKKTLCLIETRELGSVLNAESGKVASFCLYIAHSILFQLNKLSILAPIYISELLVREKQSTEENETYKVAANQYFIGVYGPLTANWPDVV